MLDEAIEVVSTGHFKDWARSSWNWIDAIMYLFNLIGIILVHIPYSKEHPDYNSGKPHYQESYYNAGRIFLSMSLIFFYIRLLHMFTIDSTLGPTILMIQKMMHDFKVFLLMFLIVAVAFGVGYAVALTDPENFQQHRLNFTSGIFFYTAFQMYGELFVEDLGSGQSRFEPSNTSTERIGFVIGLVGVYMAIVLLMMVNLLIAMFSDTYTRIKDREDVIFKYQKLELLLDVEHKFLSPPFSLFHFVIYCVTKYCRRDRRRYSKEKNDCSDNKWKDTVIRSAVVDSLEDYLKRERNLKGSETEALVQESTKMLKNKMFKLQRYVENIQSSIDVLSQLPANN